MKKLWLILFIFCAACDRTDFPKYSLVSGLRILTIKADQPEVNPGSTVNLQPVVSDIGGGGRNLSVTVTACMEPNFVTGGPPVCTTPDSTQTSSFATSTLSASGTYTGLAPVVSISVPSTLPLFIASPAYVKYNGLAYLVIYTLTAPDGNSTTAIKRIVISDPSKAAKNQNPAISGVTANGTGLASSQTYGSSSMDLGVTLSTGAESYSSMKPDGSFATHSEQITTTWYFTDGEMKYQRTSGSDSNHWDASKPASRATALIVVTTDARGGDDYKIFEFN